MPAGAYGCDLSGPVETVKLNVRTEVNIVFAMKQLP